MIATDAIARFKRLDGYDVYFLTGTDEHGIKMLQTAAKEQHHAAATDRANVPRFQAMVERMNCSNDDFIRTTEERHHRSSEAIWQRMESGRRHLSRQIFGLVLGARRGLLRRGGDPPRRERRAARAAGHAGRVGGGGELFLPALGLSGQALDLYEKQPDFVLPKERMNEVVELRARAACRTCRSRARHSTGASRCRSRPAGPPRTTNAKHIMYVWVDALTNYITGVGFPDTEVDDNSAATGRPICTSSARTSCASTRCTGRPS